MSCPKDCKAWCEICTAGLVKCDNYISQKSPTDDIRTGSSGCHLIKLCERHPAIDFLVVDNRAGKSSHRLFYQVVQNPWGSNVVS